MFSKKNKPEKVYELFKKMINFSNHRFFPEQEKAALNLLESINKEKNNNESYRIIGLEENQLSYLKFPEIDPSFSTKELSSSIEMYANKIKEQKPLVVHISGEPTFTHQVVSLLQKEGIECVASTTQRDVVMEGDTKKSKFEFVQFRKY